MKRFATFLLLLAAATAGADDTYRPGLLQAKFSRGSAYGFPAGSTVSKTVPVLASNLLSNASAAQRDRTPGLLMDYDAGGAANGSATTPSSTVNPVSGTTWKWDMENTVFAYEGQIRLPAGTTMQAYSRFDDGAAMVVDGHLVAYQGEQGGNVAGPLVAESHAFPSDRWGPVNAWIYDWSGNKKPIGCLHAIQFNTNGVTGDLTNADVWKRFVDPGDMSFLRTRTNERFFHVKTVAADGDDLLVSIVFQDVPAAAEFSAWSGPVDGGSDTAGPWASHVDFGTVSAGDSPEAVFRVHGGAAARYVRFRLAHLSETGTAGLQNNFESWSGPTGAVSIPGGTPAPDVTSVSMRQRYPWNGLVDVDVAFSGAIGETFRIELVATDKTGGTNLPMRTTWLEGSESAVCNPVDVPAPGTHRLVWNAGADLPAGFVADRVTVTAKLLNPIWTFETIPAVDPNDVWAPATVYHDVQTVASYGEIEDHTPTVRCLTDEWHLEDVLGSNVVFSGSSMGLRKADDAAHGHGVTNAISLWTHGDSTNAYRMVTLDYETGAVAYDTAYAFSIPGSDLRFFQMRDGGGRAFADLCRDGSGDVFLKSANTDHSIATVACRYQDAEHGSAVCGYFPNGIPWSDSSSTSVSSYDKGVNAAVFFSGETGTDVKEAIVLCGGSAGVRETSKYSCMGNPVGRYVVPLLDGNRFFTVACDSGRDFVPQNFNLAVGRFTRSGGWDFVLRSDHQPFDDANSNSKGVAMPDGRRIFLGGAGKGTCKNDGRIRMWQGSDSKDSWVQYPYGHPFESWARRDVTCLLPNGKFCGVDEELGLVVVNPLTGETYVASDDPAFKKGKMGCQLLPNGKVWIIPYDCEGREFEAGLDLCGKLYEVDFGFTKSFSLSSLCSPYLKVAEGDPEPSGIKVGLDPNGGSLPGVYARYYKVANPVYGTLPRPTRSGKTFRGWSTDGTVANVVATTDAVPASGIKLRAVWE